MQPFPLLTVEEFRDVLERCGCRWSELLEDAHNGTLYAIERGAGDDLKFAVIYIWDKSLFVPLAVIRSVCTALDLGPDIFGFRH
ncbi:MAG: hypothetical protein WBD07_03900 [Vicinamibacterales bacterium]